MALALMHTAKQAKKNGSRVGHLLSAIALIGVAISPLAGCGKGSGAGTGTGGGAGTGTGGRQSGIRRTNGWTVRLGGDRRYERRQRQHGQRQWGSAASGGIGSGGSSGSGGTSTGGAGTGGVGGAGGRAGSGGAAGKGGAQSSGGQTGTGGSSNPDGGQPDALRLIQNFNQSWKFKRADVSGAEATAFDDASWENVGLPHSFSLPYFMASKFYVGYGWYRKHFSVPSSWTGKNVSLEFQAAFDQAQDLRQRQEGRRAHRRLQRVFDRRHLRHQDRRQRRRRPTEQQVERARSRRSRAITPSRAGSIETCSSSSRIRCTSPGTAPGSRRRRWRRTRVRPAPWRSRRRCRTTARPPSTPR